MTRAYNRKLKLPIHKVYKDYKEGSLSVGMELMFSHYVTFHRPTKPFIRPPDTVPQIMG